MHAHTCTANASAWDYDCPLLAEDHSDTSPEEKEIIGVTRRLLSVIAANNTTEY